MNIGDRITISMCTRDDVDLAEWLAENIEDNDEIIVSDIDHDGHLCWISNCDYAISLDNVLPFNGTNFIIIEE